MTDIVDDLRDLNSMHTPKEVSDIGEKAADEIERLQLREETLSGIIDGMTARFIEAQGAVEEIEQLRGQIVFERLSLRSALDKLRKLDGDIERLRKALEIAADGFRDCGAEDLEDMCRAGIAKATGGE